MTDRAQVRAFDAVFASVFGAREPAAEFEPEDVERATATERERRRRQSRDERGSWAAGVRSSDRPGCRRGR